MNDLNLINAQIGDEYANGHNEIFVLISINSGDSYPYVFVLTRFKNDKTARRYSFAADGKYIRFSMPSNEDLVKKIKSAKKKRAPRVKIDLSNARLGDEYLTKSGKRLVLTGANEPNTEYPLIFSTLDGATSYSYTYAGKFDIDNPSSPNNLVKKIKKVKPRIQKTEVTTLPDKNIENSFDYDDATKARIKDLCKHFGIVILSPRDHMMIKELAKLI